MSMLLLLEAYQPTFGKRATPEDTDLKMPADGSCLYHAMLYVLSNGAAKLTEAAAMRFRRKVVARLRRDGLSEQASRLME